MARLWTLFPLTGGARGASWGLDDTIIFAQGVAGTGLLRGPAAGGEPGVLTTPDAEQGETNHWWPEILPGGEAVLFTIVRGEGAGDMEIAVLDLATRARTVLVPGGSNPRYALTGHIIYGADGRLWAVPFDVDRLEVTGDPVPVLENVVTKPTGAVDFGVARDGSLVYVAGDFDRLPRRTLVWVDREGREEAISTPPRGYFYPRISPDGTQVALDVRDQGSEIWIWDFVREALTRLTFDPGNDRFPVWSPDGRRIAFSSQRDGSRGNLFWQAADGTGQVELLAESAHELFPTSFSPNRAQILAYGEVPGTADDIEVAVVDGDGQTTPLLQTVFSERNADLSPNGRWVAYESNESGQEEIYVRPYPEIDSGRWQVSTGGGTQPLWARSGGELFYRNGAALMAVPIEANPNFSAGTPEVLFEGSSFVGLGGRTYDVSRDDERFILIKEDSGDTSAARQLIVVQNWFEELRQRVPVP